MHEQVFNPISFPALGITIDPNPVAFTVFGVPIYFYGIIIGLGFVIALLYALSQCERHGIDQDTLLDFVLVATPAAIIGARVYYVLNNLSLYETFWDVINIRKGGMAIYGAVIVGAVTAVVFFKLKKKSPLPMMDIGSIGLLIGQSVGRWANFINREAYGGLCDLPWRMEIYSHYYQERVCVHPTFLYESLWNLIGIIFLHNYSKKKKFSGEIFLLYVGWYGLGRSMIEGLRMDSLFLLDTSIRISQLVGILSFAVAAVMLIVLRKSKRHEAAPSLDGGNMQPEEVKTTQAESQKDVEAVEATDKEESADL